MQVQVQYYTIFKDQDLLFSKLTKNKGTAPDLFAKNGITWFKFIVSNLSMSPKHQHHIFIKNMPIYLKKT